MQENIENNNITEIARLVSEQKAIEKAIKSHRVTPGKMNLVHHFCRLSDSLCWERLQESSYSSGYVTITPDMFKITVRLFHNKKLVGPRKNAYKWKKYGFNPDTAQEWYHVEIVDTQMRYKRKVIVDCASVYPMPHLMLIYHDLKSLFDKLKKKARARKLGISNGKYPMMKKSRDYRLSLVAKILY